MSVMVFMCGNHDHLPCLKLYKFINQIIYKMSRTLYEYTNSKQTGG